jgi:hypothetical protein
MNQTGPRRDLLATSLEDEVVVYDPRYNQAHSLNGVAVAVWKHAEAGVKLELLQSLVSDELGIPISKAAVQSALRQLEQAHLLTESATGIEGSFSRREVLRKAGQYGAAAVVATPIIASALIPVAAAATSVCVGPRPPSTAGATCGPSCQCLVTLTQSGPGPTACVEIIFNTVVLCGTPVPGQPFIQCPTGTICIEADEGTFGLCYTPCATRTCSC